MVTLLEGNIEHITLFNLLQLIKLEQKTCKMVISIKELQQEANLYFKLGIIKHATLNKLTGKDAVHRLICWWTKGEFKIEEIDINDITIETINVPLESILMSAAKKTDDLADLRALVPSLESKMSFTNEAIYEIQNNLNLEIPEWVPAFVVELPITFTLAKYFDICPYNDMEASESLRYMFSTNILLPHQRGDENYAGLDAIDSLASILMEYLGFAQTQALVNEAIEVLQIDRTSKPGFSQLLAFSDYIRERISELIDEDIAQEIEWRLRARITSLS
jgi:hypothetical protein